MFTRNDTQILSTQYFRVLRETENYFEIQSHNTKHCWIIMKLPLPDIKPVTIYHKHKIKTAYYHKHADAFTVEHAIKIIKGHDDYVLHPERYTYARAEKKHRLAQ